MHRTQNRFELRVNQDDGHTIGRALVHRALAQPPEGSSPYYQAIALFARDHQSKRGSRPVVLETERHWGGGNCHHPILEHVF